MPRGHSRMPSPVITFKPNAYGIRGLNEGFSEWGIRVLEASTKVKYGETEYVILGGLGRNPEKGFALPSPIPRQPWEGFEEVGFRCVQSATKALRGTEARTSS